MIFRFFFSLLFLILLVEALSPEIIHIRAKRQPCRCVRDVSLQNSMTCGCAAPVLMPGANYAFAQYQQQIALASQLQYIQPVFTSCGCVPLMYLANPVYSCQCNGETPASSPPAISTTTPGVTVETTLTTIETTPTSSSTTTTTTATTTTPTTTITTLPTTTSSTTTTTTTPSTTTSTTTTTTTPTPTTTTTISATPETTTSTIAPTTSAPCVYPPVATVNSTTQGCFCLDVPSQVVQPLCGCQCNCQAGLSSVPNGVCSCPQQTPTLTPIVHSPPAASDSMYPLTTTCLIQIGMPQVSTQSCSCLPQYNNCAPNICCLKPAFRSYKKTPLAQDVPFQDRTAIDIIIGLLKTMKAADI